MKKHTVIMIILIISGNLDAMIRMKADLEYCSGTIKLTEAQGKQWADMRQKEKEGWEKRFANLSKEEQERILEIRRELAGQHEKK